MIFSFLKTEVLKSSLTTGATEGDETIFTVKGEDLCLLGKRDTRDFSNGDDNEWEEKRNGREVDPEAFGLSATAESEDVRGLEATVLAAAGDILSVEFS